jgi:hypothetical protein
MSADAIVLLRSIDASLKALLALHQQSAPLPVASDRDLDGRYGDPQVKFMPRDWTGPSFVGRRMSECPAALLDLLAETFDYFARKAEEHDERTDKGKPVADYKRQDAARARGWAKRIRDGKVTAPGESHQGDPGWGAEEAQDWQ